MVKTTKMARALTIMERTTTMSAFSREFLETVSSWSEILAAAFALLAAASGVAYLLSTRPLRAIEAHDNSVLQEKTASAQAEAAKAQLALDQELAKRIRGRVAEKEQFDILKNLPKEKLEVWYKKADGEAFMYAATIVQGLGKYGLGWDVPQPIPTEAHPVPEAKGMPIIGVYVIAHSAPEGKELFNPDTKSPKSC